MSNKPGKKGQAKKGAKGAAPAASLLAAARRDADRVDGAGVATDPAGAALSVAGSTSPVPGCTTDGAVPFASFFPRPFLWLMIAYSR